MKLLLSSLIIFFGTLLAAALVALGEPGQADLAVLDAASRTSKLPVQAHAAMDPMAVARWLGLR